MRYLPMIALALPLAAAGCSGCEKKDAPAAEPQAAAAPAAATPAPAPVPPSSAAPTKLLLPGPLGDPATKAGAQTLMPGANGQAAPMPESKIINRKLAAESKLRRLPTRLRLNPRLQHPAPAGAQTPDGTKQ